MPEARRMLRGLLNKTLLPAASAQFERFSARSLRVNEALIVKYDEKSGHNCLPVHQDFSLLTLNIALSDEADYDGGGTWFQHSGDTFIASRGQCIMHAGRLPHAGVPVARGTRYQLVLFLISTEFPDIAGRLQAVGA